MPGHVLGGVGVVCVRLYSVLGLCSVCACVWLALDSPGMPLLSGGGTVTAHGYSGDARPWRSVDGGVMLAAAKRAKFAQKWPLSLAWRAFLCRLRDGMGSRGGAAAPDPARGAARSAALTRL